MTLRGYLGLTLWTVGHELILRFVTVTQYDVVISFTILTRKGIGALIIPMSYLGGTCVVDPQIKN